MTAPTTRLARPAVVWHAVTTIIMIASLGTQLVMTARGIDVLVENGAIPPAGDRVIRFFSYFTVQSNILVGITCGMLVFNPARDGRVWRVVRLAALYGITVTFATYVTLLRPLVDLHGVGKLTDIGFHYVVPIMAVVGWLVFGPRPRIDENTLVLSLIWPVLYVGYTLGHGAASGWYPYPFVDVNHLGYLSALGNGLGVTLVMIGVAALFMYVDHRLTRLPADVAVDHQQI